MHRRLHMQPNLPSAHTDHMRAVCFNQPLFSLLVPWTSQLIPAPRPAQRQKPPLKKSPFLAAHSCTSKLTCLNTTTLQPHRAHGPQGHPALPPPRFQTTLRTRLAVHSPHCKYSSSTFPGVTPAHKIPVLENPGAHPHHAFPWPPAAPAPPTAL